jgi:hypothetical protein
LWKHINHRQQSGHALALRFTDEVYKITAQKGKQVHVQCPLKRDSTPLTSLNLSADLLPIESDDDLAKGSQALKATLNQIMTQLLMHVTWNSFELPLLICFSHLFQFPWNWTMKLAIHHKLL